jgi:hypothetical protein
LQFETQKGTVVENSNLNLEATEPTLPEPGEEGAEDALDLALSEAPEGSSRERYRYARERIFPLIEGLEDEGERGPVLDDVAKKLKLGKKDLRNSFTAFEKDLQDQERGQHGEGRAEDDLAPEPGTNLYERAMELLRCPDLLRKAAEDMERLGHVGEPGNKQLAFVCAISARAGRPIQPSTHAESSTGKNFLWDSVLSLLPPELVMKRSAISDKALFRTEADLRGAVLYLQEVAGSEGADFTIRVLQSAQYLEYEATEKMPDGSFGTVVHRKEGPVVVVQTTTEIRLYHENDTRVFPIYLDESVEQTERIVYSALHRASTGGISQEDREDVLGVWHSAIRLLEPAEVIVPYAELIQVPSHRVRVRRDVNRLLDVIRVHAWLHQHGRERDEQDRILATEADFHKAVELVADSLQRAWKSLTPAEEAVLAAIGSLPKASQKNGFTRSDLEVEGHDTRRVQDALKALSETGYLERDRRGGPGGFRYTLTRDAETKGLAISLRPPDDDGEDNAGETNLDARGDSAESDATEGDEDEGGEARGTTRKEDRAVETPVLREEHANARPRAGEPEDDLSGDEPRDEDEGEEEDEQESVDYLGELTELAWYRAQTVFAVEDTDSYLSDDDPLVRRLRHGTPIYHGRLTDPGAPGDDTPLVLSAEDVLGLGGAEEGGAQERCPTDRLATPGEARARLERTIRQLQRGRHRFHDPGLDEFFYMLMEPGPRNPESWCKEGRLHVERWAKEGTDEEVWALIALREGWSPPDSAIERAVWQYVTGNDEGGESEDLPPSNRFTF